MAGSLRFGLGRRFSDRTAKGKTRGCDEGARGRDSGFSRPGDLTAGRWRAYLARPDIPTDPDTPMTAFDASSLQLGHETIYPKSPDEARLDRVPNPQADTLYLARFTVPEFTSLCPVTGQPDFAHLVIDYVPKDWLVESKSLKLYMTSFRNHGAFHEDCTVAIGRRLADLLAPHWLRIGGYWYPRGGIPIDVFW